VATVIAALAAKRIVRIRVATDATHLAVKTAAAFLEVEVALILAALHDVQ